MDSAKPQKVLLAGIALLAIGAGAYWLGSRHHDNARRSDTVALGPRRLRTEEPEVVKARPEHKRNHRRVNTPSPIRRTREPRVRPETGRRVRQEGRREQARKKEAPPWG